MRLVKEDCVAVAIDYQEKLVPVMADKEALLQKSAMLLQGLGILGVPVLETRQYPKGLGDTVPEIKAAMTAPVTLDKMAFGCCDDAGFMAALRESGKKAVILCGIESHVCVLQTLIALKELGFTPVLIADCVSSRSTVDRHYALRRARDEGAVLTTAESLLFELLRVAGGDTFKAISKLVK